MRQRFTLRTHKVSLTGTTVASVQRLQQTTGLGWRGALRSTAPEQVTHAPTRRRLLNPHTEGKAPGQGDEDTDRCCSEQTGGMTHQPSHFNGMQSLRKEHLYKVLVIGDLGVGKTSIIRRYVHQTYSSNYRATIGVDFALKVLNWDSETVRLQLWDIAGGTVKDMFTVFYVQGFISLMSTSARSVRL